MLYKKEGSLMAKGCPQGKFISLPIKTAEALSEPVLEDEI